MRSCWLLLLLIACSKSEPRSAPAPRTLPPTTALREKHPAIEKLTRDFVAAAKPCDVTKVADLMERQEFMRVVQTHAKEHHGTLLATEVLLSTGAMKICSWMADAADIRFLHVRTAEGQPRAVVRKVGDQGFRHFDVRTIDTPQGPRILDLYSHNNGTWISLDIADTASVPLADNAPGAATILTVNKLENAGKHAEALATLDTLPQATRQSKPIQSLRVAIAGRAGVDAYNWTRSAARYVVRQEIFWSSWMVQLLPARTTKTRNSTTRRVAVVIDRAGGCRHARGIREPDVDWPALEGFGC